MRKGIHPEYKKTVIKCVCGNEIETGSVQEDITVEKTKARLKFVIIVIRSIPETKKLLIPKDVLKSSKKDINRNSYMQCFNIKALLFYTALSGFFVYNGGRK